MKEDVFNFLSSAFCPVQSMQQVSSVVMTKPELRFSPLTRLGEVHRTEGMTGGHRRTKSPPKCQGSPTGNTTWSRFTTAACGQITATIILHTVHPATAGRTSLRKQVRKTCGGFFFGPRGSVCVTWFYNFFFLLASVLGDPHFITFDGSMYTFNGKGEYVLLHSPQYQLTVQGRTEPMKSENGKMTKVSKFFLLL